MTVREIVKQYLQENGYDGLYYNSCACEISDLMPCGEYFADCKPGYKIPCPGPESCALGGECLFHIGPKRPQPDKDQKGKGDERFGENRFQS